uniref:Probable peptidoglycan glycosyltransferase FtsW n=1 Tax=candidate division WOR-3 bacterium TaxID=2052148 RepID=A0A7V4E4J4_UNCW3
MKLKKAKIDLVFLEIISLLTFFSLLAIYSFTMIEGPVYFQKHLFRIILGIIALFIGILIPYEFWSGKRAKILYFLALVLLSLTFLFSNTIRQFSLLFLKFQPQEFCKIFLLFFVADFLSKMKEEKAQIKGKEFNKFRIEYFLIILVILLVLFQPAIGTAVILFASVLVMFIFAGVKPSVIFSYVFVITFLIFGVINVFPYAKKRFKKFKEGKTYQQYHSQLAIGSGGLFGKGIGCGRQKFKFLPKIHTDFIFSGMAEELGFVPMLFLWLGYFILLWRGLTIAQNAGNNFGKLFGVGFTFMLSFYISVHIFSAFALIPVTGQPLPFISYGGSALISNLFASGVMLNISREKKFSYEF